MLYNCKMTTELPYKEIISKLIVMDNTLEKVMASVQKEIQPMPSVDIYMSLMHSIVSQQLSTKVADIIWHRFLELFPNREPTPTMVVNQEFQTLRAVGLSGAKSNYIQNVAQFALSNDMLIDKLVLMSDEEVISYLTAIKGVGKWTVQMTLMFPLDRPNVFPIDDLGIQTKMKSWYNLKSEKKQLKTEMEAIALKWEPFRSLACKYLWASKVVKS
ncbi:MAG: DNA-3-methyladenine glycosylase II [Bacteroidia bacterium]|jgi:DNA-3-methyladenine glycosylase II